MTLQQTGTIIKTPDNAPGLLIVAGQQKPFTLEGVWKSPVAPAVNMAVDVEFDAVGSVTGLTVVDPQQAASDKLNQIGGAAQQHGKEAAEMARQGAGALVARMGKVTLAAAVVIWLAWFFMPGLGFSVSFFGAGQTKSFTLWDALTLDPNNNMNPGSIGFLNLLVLAGIAAPFVASFLRNRQARFLYAAPLACLLIAWITIEYEFSQVLAASGITANIAGIKLLPDYGTVVAGVASLVVAARVLRGSATQNVRSSVASAPVGGVVIPASGFCRKCGKPLSATGEFCIGCGARRA
jgi:hypothetical protein